MRSTQYLIAALSTLTLLDGALAQRNGGKQKAGQASSSVAASGAASSGSAAAATPPSTAAAAAGASSGAAAAPVGDTAPADESTTINPELVASGSKSNGNPTNGQAPSLTDNANFINFCAGRTITNGLQNITGSCNPIPMGDIPAKANMISTILLNPKNGDNLQANQPFNISLQTTNLVAGSFTNPNVTYYAAPQHLLDGKIIGHVHVVVQDMGDNTVPVDPSKFAFFKGIDDAGDGKGKLQASVTNGVPAGNYRICTMVAAANHQAVLMPVAQRGAQDDCIRITVGGGAAAAGGAAAGGAAAAANGTASSSAAAASGTPATQKRQFGARSRVGRRFVDREMIV